MDKELAEQVKRRAEGGREERHPRRRPAPARSTRCSRTCSRRCRGTSREQQAQAMREQATIRKWPHEPRDADAAVTRNRTAPIATAHEHDPGDQLGAGRDDGARPRRRRDGRGRRLFRRRVPRHRRACRRSTARRACSTRRSPKAASSASRSAWAPMACGRWPRSSSPITSIRRSTSSCREAARLRYRSAGEFTAPITVRTPFGGGIFGGQTHSQSPEAHLHPCLRA